jgi:hypothetical protein
MAEFQSGVFAQAGQGMLAAGAGLAQGMLEKSPAMGYAQGLLAGIKKKQEEQQLNLQQQTLDFNIAAKEKEYGLEEKKFAHLVRNDSDKVDIERQKLALTNKQIELSDLRDQQKILLSSRGLDIQERQGDRKLDLEDRNSGVDNAYKQSLINVNEYSMNPNNPDNLVKMAQSARALKDLQAPSVPLSKEGKIAYDLKTGAVSPEFLNSLETSFDPATGQSTTRFNMPSGEGVKGISPKAMEDLQKQDNTYISKIRDDVTSGAKEISDLTALADHYKTFGATGPIYGKLKLYTNQLGSLIGLPGSEKIAAAGEAIRSASSKAALLSRKDMPGPMSDKDRDFLTQMAPSLDKSESGNRLIIEAAKARTGLMQQYLDFTEKFRRKNGTLTGLESAWGDFTNKNPVFDKDKEGNVSVIQPKNENVDRYFNAAKIDTNSSEIKNLLAKGYTLEQIKAVM